MELNVKKLSLPRDRVAVLAVAVALVSAAQEKEPAPAAKAEPRPRPSRRSPPPRRRPTREEGRRREGRGREAEGRLVGRHLERPCAAGHRPRRHLRPHRGHRGGPHRQEAVVPGGRLGRRVADRQRRHDLDAGLRRRGLLLDRLRRDRPDEPARRVGGHGREQLAAERRLRRRRLQERGRRPELEERRPEGLRAHRQDRRPPGGLERRLRRGPGPALGPRRRPRALQDDRRRQDLERRADDRREHRCDRRRHGPARPGHPGGRLLPAPAPRLHAHRRRPRVGRPQDDGRREDVEEGDERPPQGGDGPHRARDRPDRARHAVRARRDRGRQQGGRDLPLHEPRRELGEARRLRPRRPHVLPGDLRRPEGPRAALLDGRLPEGVGRRGQDLAEPRGALQARGQPRDVGQPRRHGPLPRGRRRRALPELRPGGHVAVDVEPAGHPVLPGGGGQLVARLLHLRRHPGQQHPGRPLAHFQRPRHRQPRLVRHLGRRRLPRPHRPHRPQHRLLHAPARRPRPVRPEERGSRPHPAPREAWRRPAALELGLPARPLAPQADPALLRGAARLPERGPGRQLDAHQRGPHPEGRPQQAQGDGQGLGPRRGGQGRLDVLLRQHRLARRVPARRWPPLRGHRRRPRPGERGRRQDLAPPGDVPGRSRDELRQRPVRLALRRQRRLRDLQQPQGRRFQAVRPPQRRPRPHLDVHHRRPPGPRQRLDDRRGHRGEGPPLRGNRVRALLQPRRREEVGSAQGRDARDRRARPGDPEAGERPGRGDLRPRLLRPRRPHAAPPREARRPRPGGARLSR